MEGGNRINPSGDRPAHLQPQHKKQIAFNGGIAVMTVIFILFLTVIVKAFIIWRLYISELYNSMLPF